MAKKARPTTTSATNPQGMNTVNPPTEDRSQSRASFHSGVTWREAVADVLLQTRGSGEENNVRFAEERLRLPERWDAADLSSVRLAGPKPGDVSPVAGNHRWPSGGRETGRGCRSMSR